MLIGRDELGHRSETVRRANLSAIVRELHAQRPAVALGARRPHRPDPQRHPRPHRRARRRGLVVRGPGGPRRHARPPLAAGPARSRRRRRPRARDRRRLARGRDRRARRRGLRPRPGRPAARAHRASTDIVADARRARGRPSAVGCRPTDSIVGVGVAVVGVVRRSDGMVSMAPNLGWRDEPLGERLAEALGMDVPIAFANEADLAALAEHRRGAARGIDDVVLVWGSVGVGGGLIVDGRPLTGAAGYGGEVGHIPVNPDGLAVSLRLDRLLGDRGRRRARCCAAPVARRRAAARRVDARPRRGRGRRSRPRSTPSPRPAAGSGIGLAGIINILNPSLVLLGGRLTAELSVRRGRPWRPSSIGASCAPLAGSCGSSRRRSATTLRCSVPRSSRSNHCSPIQRPGCVPAGPCPRWQAPDGATERRMPRQRARVATEVALRPTSGRLEAATAQEESQRCQFDG